MQIEIRMDESCAEPKVIVLTNKVTAEVNALVRRLSEEAPQVLVGFRQDSAEILEQQNVIRIYAEGGKVMAQTAAGTYALRLRLYELEERLDRSCFVRISNSEIINLKKVKNFDLSFSGTICVSLANGTVTYVSRRYVARIKQVLGI